ncbi:MAG: AAA family ATPase [Elusimicrobiota bacterium]
MYLKYVEINGFKSFANRVKIEFFPGINVIVGPNGCGKSNIVDAIKWCIGEMSSKSLRMPSMLDVIFAGTTKRQPMNLAEVTLIFDNSERKLNVDFNEVAITRKIYRSEESEYFINRVGCRLKDIRELFLDTGVGSNGYSIIDQGEIEEIFLSNAEERREVFEEVAGISKYKAKREETLRKLEKVEYDLSIVESSVAVIEQQIKKLEQEAKRAKLQQKYRQELKDAEIAYNVKTINAYFSEIEQEKKNLSPILSEIDEINVDIAKLGAELSNKEIILNDKIQEEKSLAESISNIRADTVRVEGVIVKNDELISEISRQLSDLEMTRQKNIENKNKYIPALSDKKAKLEMEKSLMLNIESEYKKIENEYKEIENKIAEVDNALRHGESEHSAFYQNEINLSNIIIRTESELAHIGEDIANVNREKEKLTLEMTSVEKEISLLNENIMNLNNDRNLLLSRQNQLLTEIEKENNKLKAINDEIAKISVDIASSRARLDSLLKDAERDTYWIGTNEILNANLPGVYNILRNILKFDTGDRYIVEDAFGKFIDAIVVKDRDTALNCIAHLKSTGKGRARFLVLENVPKIVYENKPVGLNISYPDEYSDLVHCLLSRVIFNDGDVISDIWVVGGAKNVSTNEPYWGETNELKEQISRFIEKSMSLEKEQEVTKTSIARLSQELSEVEKEIDTKNIEIAKFESSLKNEFERKSVLEEEISFINNDILKLSDREKEIKVLIEKYKSEINEIKNKTTVKKQEIDELKNRRISLEKELIQKKGSLSSIEYRLSSYKTEIERIENETAELEKRINDINIEKETYLAKKTEMENRLLSLRSDNEKLKINLDELNNDRKEYEIKRNNIYQEIEQIKADIARLNALIRENNEVLKEQIEKKQEVELRINTLNTKIDDINLKLISEYQVKYEEVKENYTNVEVDIDRIEYLKKRIENMGAVNMTAPEEYDALIKEYNDKKVHIDDLKTAKENLKNAIVQINQTTKENFKQTFDKVQEYFKKIYATLFNGGTANLVLTNPDNLLETGIEIMMHPPGKRLVNISQLSGGEKSLAALALVFSFFCVNPSPFCVMDEVDAALDEANVERFVRLLKEFAPTTQFIVITHNKRTMEVGDKIYGVTMEELGVSKVISVDLKRAMDMSVKSEVKI